MIRQFDTAVPEESETEPMTSPPFWSTATDELRRADPALGRIIDALPGEALAARDDAFYTLARSIVGQQISTRAAASVWERLQKRAGKRVTPRAIVRRSVDDLRTCGLSGRKASYIRELAEGFLDGTHDPRRWRPMDDEAVIIELTQARGVGRWTAEMFLIFHLLRPDVLPLADIGVQRAAALVHGREERYSQAKLEAVGEVWRPWRSVATWYLWRSLDPMPVVY
jgi:DNA-3-methyladenine glycosylase II